jgi:homogentisate 1,2-dioxygenase
MIVQTEMGKLYLKPGEIMVIPRGIKYSVYVPQGILLLMQVSKMCVAIVLKSIMVVISNFQSWDQLGRTVWPIHVISSTQ